jgi:hypothetical protein
MVEVPRHDANAPLRAVIPEWLTRPPEVEIMRREAAAVEAQESAAIDLAETRRMRSAALLGALILVGSVVTYCLLSAKSPSALGVFLALVTGGITGLAAWRLGDGVHTWGIACGVAAFGLAIYDGSALTKVFLPGMAAMIAVVAGFGRDPSFRIR